ncbi:DeoR/GlpR transcriptional regulator [Kocuria sp. JC486]|uniref:Lactose phosphotransferase system repressor n=1 Tax=Kocuria soli TaxID=2485125 RepID=A0A3N3ZNX1_9MICC|nr:MULTISPECIES: DeoR/GlpR family DNA-binding transcription regulator [Kocuria]NHU85226.1 DeoR/GlpR transcriptional regulator [Kocuria sp. JC486]ROZ61699.1 DeoR/GlpR transcriptional regulator [Kocuria soli]
MFAEERQAEIARLVGDTRRVSGADLARRFTVTMETIRRDLAALESEGVLRRVHGGAVSLDRTDSVEQSLDSRATLKTPAKRRIAAAALELLEYTEATSVVLDAGSTVETFADALATRRTGSSDQSLLVMTHALHVAGRLADQPEIDLELVGGRVRTLTWAASGVFTAEQYNRYRADVAFLGCNGVAAGFGFSTPELPEAAVKTAIVNSARKVVVLCDAEKHNHENLARFATFTQVDALITDAAPTGPLAAALEEGGVEVIVA